MFELDEQVESTTPAEQIDGLSTRLILDGARSLCPADFERLSQAAADHGDGHAAEAALRIARAIAPPCKLSVPELTRLLSSGLVDLRRLLDAPADGLQPASGSSLSSPETTDDRRSTSPETGSLAADEELIREFIAESGEHLATIEGQLLILEKDNSATETLNAVFRGFHTIKGLAGFLEFAEIQSLAHEVETLLDLARTSQLTATPAVVDVLLESTDIVRHELAGIGQRLAGKTPPPTHVDAALLERIRDVAHSGPHPNASDPAEVARAEEGMAAAPQRQERQERRAGDPFSVRIDTCKLDQLMDMVGEMVISQTLIGHSPVLASVKDARFLRDLAHLARITADVQRIATGMRMVPIGLQFQKSARMARDLARRLDKQIVFEAAGEETELDKSIAEELSDPLLHMVRNSVDHGIETTEERVVAGKDPTAHVRVSAYHQSGQIVVAISDDGRGLDREKILARARRSGLIQPGQQPTDNEIFLLIFEAGFSTAKKVTEISGRGVGMDVVRRQVQKLRGRIDIQSKAGEGTTFYIRLPLTLAIIEGLVVAVGEQRYIVPIFSVREMFRPTAEMLSTVQGNGEMAMVRGGLLPIVRLHRRFETGPRSANLTEGMLIVAESEGRRFCLFVDDVVDKQEVVIKGLGWKFKEVAGVAGCAILGDGHVGLILDIDGICRGRL